MVGLSNQVSKQVGKISHERRPLGDGFLSWSLASCKAEGFLGSIFYVRWSRTACWHEINRFECIMRGLQTLISDTSSRCVSKCAPNNPSMSPTCNYLMGVYHKPHLKDSKKYFWDRSILKKLRKKALIVSGKLQFLFAYNKIWPMHPDFRSVARRVWVKMGVRMVAVSKADLWNHILQHRGCLALKFWRWGLIGDSNHQEVKIYMLHMTFAIMWYVYYVCIKIYAQSIYIHFSLDRVT